MFTRLSHWLACLVPALVFAGFGYMRRWAGDDGFINLRVVSQLLDGNGFVYNAGERCEAVTSAGWLLWLWLLGELGLNLDSAAWVTSLLCSFAGMLLAALASTRVQAPDEADEPGVTLPLGVLVYGAIPVAWDYATSALENGIGLAWFGLSYWLLARLLDTRRASRPSPLRAAAVVGLAPLMRPDYALYALPFGLLCMLAGQSWRERARIALCCAAPAGSYQLFRMGYFAALVPNTAIAKEAFEPRWDQGLLYLDNTFGTYQLWAPLALVALAVLAVSVRSLRRKAYLQAALPLSFALTGMLHITYVVRLGGDFMHGRMLLPGIFALCAAGATVRVSWRALPERVWAGLTGLAFLYVLSWNWLCTTNLRPEVWVHQILDERRWWSDTARSDHPTHLDDYKQHQFYQGPVWVKERIAEGCPAGMASLGDDITDLCKRFVLPDMMEEPLRDHPEDRPFLKLDPRAVPTQVVAVYAFRPLGVSSRVLGLRFNLVDSFGLADPLAARAELRERGRPGHEKSFPTVWLAAKYAHESATDDPRVALAKQALKCGALKQLHDATHAPLTLSRFLENIRLSYKLHKLRVPADPAEAVARFCPGS
jgi:arabinofuranosyltransferase